MALFIACYSWVLIWPGFPAQAFRVTFECIDIARVCPGGKWRAFADYLAAEDTGSVIGKPAKRTLTPVEGRV